MGIQSSEKYLQLRPIPQLDNIYNASSASQLAIPDEDAYFKIVYSTDVRQAKSAIRAAMRRFVSLSVLA